METTSPSLQAEDSVDRSLLEHRRINGREMVLRTLLIRVLVVTVFLASSLIIFNLLPFYPSAMSLFLAVVCAAVAYRWPAVALLLMLLFATPAYSYQLGGALWALGAMGAIAVVLPLCVGKLPGAALGCAVGASAGVLMLTDYYLLSLPLLGGISLLRLKGSTVGAGWGVFTFLGFYLPFLFLTDPALAQGETVPLFLRVEYAQQPTLEHLNLDAIADAFRGATGGGAAFPGLSSYFVEKWGGLALILSTVMAFLAAPAVLNLTSTSDETSILRRRMIPLVSLLIMEIVFLAPLQLLGAPLEYHTAFGSWRNVGVLTAIMVALGGAGFVMETWLIRRNLRVQLGSDLSILSRELYGLLEDARERLKQVASVCKNKDLEDEKAAIAQCEEKVALTLETMRALGVVRLQTSRNEFANMRSQLCNIQLQLEAKLINYLDDSRHIYDTTVEEAKALGIPVDDDALRATAPLPEESDYDHALREQQHLNDAFKGLATKLVSAGDMLADTVKEEFDPEFSLATIDIGHGFLDQERFEDASRTILEDLQIIDGRIENSIVDLADRIIGMAGKSRDVIVNRLIPVFEAIGDSESLAECQHTVAELEALAKSVEGSRTLADLIAIVEESRKLANLTTATVDGLSRRITALESDNDERCPPKYDWGKNSRTTADVQQLLNSKESVSSSIAISSRFTVIEMAVRAMEHQAKVVKQYSQASETLINYHNVERMLGEKLSVASAVAGSELPVKPKYATDYLRMYAAKNHDDVILDSRSGVIRLKSGKSAVRDEMSQ
jgi:hypothetical protein